MLRHLRLFFHAYSQRLALSRQTPLQLLDQLFSLLKLPEYLLIALERCERGPWIALQRLGELFDISKKTLSFLRRARRYCPHRVFDSSVWGKEALLGDRVAKNLPQLPNVLGIGDLLLVHPLNQRIEDTRRQKLFVQVLDFPSPCDGGARFGQVCQFLREIVNVDELIEFPNRDSENVGRAGPPDHIHQAVGDHLLLFGVPFTPLPMDVDPDAEPLLVGQGPVGDFCRNAPVLLLLLVVDENLGIRPSPIAIDDAKFVRNVRVRLQQQRLEDAFIGFDLPLEFGVFLRPHARLLRIRHDLIEIDLVPVRPEDGSSEPPFLPAIGQFSFQAVAS